MKHVFKWLGVVVITSLLFLSFSAPAPVQASSEEAPSAQSPVVDILNENFEGAFPPPGWEVIDNAGTGKIWQRSDLAGVLNYCEYGSGLAAVAHPGDTNGSFWNTSLISPPLDLTEKAWASLEYASHFQDYAGNGQIWLDVTEDDGATWINLRHQTIDDPPGGDPAVGGTLETETLTLYTGHVIRLRWRFQASASPAWMWHMDAVKVTAKGGEGEVSFLETVPLNENFEGDFPAEGWELFDNAGQGGVWETNVDAGQYNFCQYGDGTAVGTHPWSNNAIAWDTELWSPPIDLTGAKWVELWYASYFQDFAGNGEIWLDISTDDGASWVNLRNQTSDDPPGGTPAVGGTQEVEDLSAYRDHVIRLRWRFQATATAAWLWQIDEVMVKVLTPLPKLENSYIAASRIMPPNTSLQFNYIVEIRESTSAEDFVWDWDISMLDDLPEELTVLPESLWCSGGSCWQEDSSVHWLGVMPNNSNVFLVFDAVMLTPGCGEMMTNTITLDEAFLQEPVNISTVTGFWHQVWVDEPLTLFPPAGWTVNDYAGSLQPGSVFSGADPGGRGNNTGGQGSFVIVDDDVAGSGVDVKTDLQLPAQDIPVFSSTYLLFRSDFDQHGGAAAADVQISLDDGSSWDSLLHWDADMPGPVTTKIDLTPYAGETGVILRFYYDDGGTDAGWWALDDIQIVGCYGQFYFPMMTQD